MGINKKVVVIIIVLLVVIAAIYFYFNKNKPAQTLQGNPTSNNPSQASQDGNNPRLLSTKPDPLEGALISADEIIELRFNKALENGPELKLKIEPEIKFETKLSSDKKTAKIYPQRPYDLGMTYTLFLSTEAKFEGGGRLKGEFFHFHTIKYRGI